LVVSLVRPIISQRMRGEEGAEVGTAQTISERSVINDAVT